MLLRVEKISASAVASANPTSADASLPLHACLVTSAGSGGGSHRGRILTIGRKNCDVSLGDDKCVSRSHCSVRLVSIDRPAPVILPAGGVGGSGANAASGAIVVSNEEEPAVEFDEPRTPEEEEACRRSDAGCVAVLEEMGSKFGTFVSFDDEPKETGEDGDENDDLGGKSKKKGQDEEDDETGDEETDDEGAPGTKDVTYIQLTERQKRSALLLSGLSDEASLPKFRKLEPGTSVVLTLLSAPRRRPHRGRGGGNEPSAFGSVLVLFGPQGSGVKLTRCPLRFTFSRIDKKTQTRLSDRAHLVGGTASSHWDVDVSTHLVTKDKTATAKLIMAWAKRRPIVAASFVDALLARRRAGDPLPKEEDYSAPGQTQLDGISDNMERDASLQGYRVCVLLNDDNGSLAQSAGAEVLKIYEEAPSSSKQDFQTWWEKQNRSAVVSGLALVVVESSSKKAKPWKDWLDAGWGDGENAARYTAPKHLAKAISNPGNRNRLLDIDGDPINFAKSIAAEFGATVLGKDYETNDSHGRGGTDPNAAEAEARPPQAEERGKVEDERAQDGEVDTSDRGGNADCPPAAEKASERMETEEGVEDVLEVGSVAVTVARSEPSEPATEHDPGLVKPVDEARPNLQRDEDRREGGESGETANAGRQKHRRDEGRFDESNDYERGSERTKRKRLAPAAEDGWFTAAPSRGRKAYIPTPAELSKNGGALVDGMRPPAETATVQGLVVGSLYDEAPVRIARSRNFPVGANKNDFKRFRKNSVLYGDPDELEIDLVSVLPKETERQRQMEFRQQELERERDAADALFNDGGGLGRGGRGRSSGGGGIRGFLSQASTAKKRGRR